MDEGSSTGNNPPEPIRQMKKMLAAFVPDFFTNIL